MRLRQSAFQIRCGLINAGSDIGEDLRGA